MNSRVTKVQRACTFFLAALIGAATVASQPGCAGGTDGFLQEPSTEGQQSVRQETPFEPNTLLLMPDAKTKQQDIDELLKEVHGTVAGSLSHDGMNVIVITTEKGKLEQTEKKLQKSKKFEIIQRNHQYKPDFVPPTDVAFTDQWHLSEIHAPEAWENSKGRVWLSVFDSGCQGSINELYGYKTTLGFDGMQKDAYFHALISETIFADFFKPGANRGARVDTGPTGHGTKVATTATALTNNGINGAGVVPYGILYPVKITRPNGYGDDIAILAGMIKLMTIIEKQAPSGPFGIKPAAFLRAVSPTFAPKIVNISYGIIPDFDRNTILQNTFKKFHDKYGGLIFVSAGNDKTGLTTKQYPYMNVVSAIDKGLKRAEFSNWGRCVTLTAPGDEIVCTNKAGNLVSVRGTSFSAPIAAAVAALVWGANPSLPNTYVDYILRSTARRPKSGAVTLSYGYGMVEADKAVRMAKGIR